MFERLDVKQAIVSNDKLIVMLNDGTYEVDDTRFTLNRRTTFTINKGSTLFKVTAGNKKLVGFKLKDDAILSPEEYESVKKSIFGEFETDYYGDRVYPDTATKIKALESWIPYENPEKIYEQEPEKKTPIEFTVIGEIEDTGSPYIETCFHIGATRYQGGGIYKVYTHKITMKVWNELAQKYTNYKFANDSDCDYLYFAKINGNFILNGDFYKKGRVKLFTNLKEAQEYEKFVEKKTRIDILKAIKPMYADELDMQDLIKHLNYLNKTVANLSVMKKSRDDKQSLLRSISGKIKELESRINSHYDSQNY